MGAMYPQGARPPTPWVAGGGTAHYSVQDGLNPVPSLRCCTSAFVACIVLAAQAQQLPDPRLTPGAFADSST